jgi:hypothetical protein
LAPVYPLQCGGFHHSFRSFRFSDIALVRIVVIVGLLLIVLSLGTALYYLYHDRGQGTRMVKALAIRVVLSASLIAFLLISYHFGWIGEKGLR